MLRAAHLQVVEQEVAHHARFVSDKLRRHVARPAQVENLEHQRGQEASELVEALLRCREVDHRIFWRY